MRAYQRSSMIERRRPGEDYAEAILRLVELETSSTRSGARQPLPGLSGTKRARASNRALGVAAWDNAGDGAAIVAVVLPVEHSWRKVLLAYVDATRKETRTAVIGQFPKVFANVNFYGASRDNRVIP